MRTFKKVLASMLVAVIALTGVHFPASSTSVVQAEETTSSNYTYKKMEVIANPVANSTANHTGYEDLGPEEAFDDDLNFKWHSYYNGSNGTNPGTVDLTEATEIPATLDGLADVTAEGATRIYIGGEFNQRILLGKFGYLGRQNSTSTWMKQYGLYVADSSTLAEGAELTDADYKLVASGEFTPVSTSTPVEVELAEATHATHFKLVAFTSADGAHVSAAKIDMYQVISNYGYTNIASEATITKTSTATDDANYPRENLVDGDDSTIFQIHNAAVSSDQSVILTYTRARMMDGFRIAFENGDNATHTYEYSILASADGETWDEIVSHATATRAADWDHRYLLDEAKAYSQIKITVHNCIADGTNAWVSLAEFEVYGEVDGVLPVPVLSITEPVVGGTLGKVEYADYTEERIEDIADSPATLTTEGLTIENVDGYQAFNGKITAANAGTNNGKFDVYGNTPLLIRFKVYVPSGITNNQTLIGKTDNQYGLQVNGAQLKLYANHDNTVWSETNFNNITTNAWHDVIATYTYDTGLNLFVDDAKGTQDTNRATSGYNLQQHTSRNFAIGYNNSDSNTDSRKFVGKFADVVMYTGDQVPTITSETTAAEIKAALATKTPMFELDVTAESGTKPNYTITSTAWTDANGGAIATLDTAGVNTVTATLTPDEGYVFTEESKPATMALAGTENTVAVSSATINDDGTMTVSCQFDGSLILQKDNLEAAIAAAEKVLALNPSDEDEKTNLESVLAEAKNALASQTATTESLNEVTNSLTQSVNAVVAVKGNTETGYTVTVLGGGTLKHAGDYELAADTTEQTGLNYNDKVIVSAPTESEKGEFVGWEVLGDIVGKGTLDRETKTYQYTFYMPNDVTITAVYGTANEDPVATMTNVVVTTNADSAEKVDIKFVGQLSYSQDDYELVAAGLKWLGSAAANTDKDVATEGKTVVANEVNKSLQFSITLKGVPKGEGKFVRGVVYMTLRNKVTGEEVTFYSAEHKVLSGTTE